MDVTIEDVDTYIEMRALERQIEALEAEMTTKRKSAFAKANLQALLKRHALLYESSSPIAPVPEEVLSNIFAEAVLSWEAEITPNYKDLRRLLISLCSVSCKWRFVAIKQTPRLWRNALYSVERPMGFYPLKICIERSRATHLNIAVEGLSSLLSMHERLGSMKQLERVDVIHVREPRAIKDANDGDEDSEEKTHITHDVQGKVVDTMIGKNPPMIPSELSCPKLMALFLDVRRKLSQEAFAQFLLSYWNVVFLKISDSNLSMSLNNFRLATFPNLEELELEQSSRRQIRAVLGVIYGWDVAKLTVRFDGARNSSNRRMGDLPTTWTNVQKLTLMGTLGAFDVLDLLAFTPNIAALMLFLNPPRVFGEDSCYDELLRAWTQDAECDNRVPDTRDRTDYLACRLRTLSLNVSEFGSVEIMKFLDARCRSPATTLGALGISTVQFSKYSEDHQGKLSRMVHLYEGWLPPLQAMPVW